MIDFIKKVAVRLIFGEKIWAASPWEKYIDNPDYAGNPAVAEWCLWSVIISDVRSYVMGFVTENKQLYIIGFGVIDIDDNTYFARINKMIFDDENN